MKTRNRIMIVLALLVGVIVGIAIGGTTSAPPSQSAAVAPAASPLKLGSLKPLPKWTYDSLRASVVEIQSEWDGTVSVQSKYVTAGAEVSTSARCTAWFVKAGAHPVLVTNAHCVNDPDVRNKLLNDAYGKLPQSGPFGPTKGAPVGGTDSALGEPTLSGDNIFPISGKIMIRPTLDSIRTSGMQATRLNLIDTQETSEGDLALLEASGPIPGIRPLSVATSVPATGSALTSIGYPADVTEGDVEGYESAVFTPGSVIGKSVYKEGFKVIDISSPLGHGMSGGPTVDRYGNVIGQNTLMNNGQQLNRITDTTDLRRYLTEHGIKPAAPGTRVLRAQ